MRRRHIPLESPEGETKLKVEAKSMNHFLTHYPYNQFYEGCVLGKMAHAQRRRVHPADQNKYNKFGDTVTCDHIRVEKLTKVPKMGPRSPPQSQILVAGKAQSG